MFEDALYYFERGGLVMWPLLLCSFAVFTIAVERFLFYRAADSGSAFAQQYCGLLQRHDMGGAAELAQKTPGLISQTMYQAAATASDAEAMTDYLDNELDILTALLKSKLDYLGLIVTLAPLLGLLGTIIGMIGAFSIFNLETGAPLAITGGVGEALIATASGLCVAIIALCFHSYYTHRMDAILTRAERCAAALIQARKRSGRP